MPSEHELADTLLRCWPTTGDRGRSRAGALHQASRQWASCRKILVDVRSDADQALREAEKSSPASGGDGGPRWTGWRVPSPSRASSRCGGVLRALARTWYASS